jgi:hypothetical protein
VDPARLLDELLAVARKLGIHVRIEPLLVQSSRAGGLCRLRGRTLVLLDERASIVERGAVLAEALAGLELDNVYMPPEVRLLIALTKTSRVLPSLTGQTRPKPGVRACRDRK